MPSAVFNDEITSLLCHLVDLYICLEIYDDKQPVRDIKNSIGRLNSFKKLSGALLTGVCSDSRLVAS